MRDLNKEILVITSFLKVCKSDFELSFTENDIEELFESKISYNDLNYTLDVLAENDVLSYIRGGEDGFAEGFDITIKKEKCFDFIQTSYITRHTELLNEINKQSEELKDIYGFLPNTIVQEINDSKTTLNGIVNSIKDSEFLKPLEPKIKEINDYLEKTENVIKNYENIYLNVIKPIKREGKQGIKATTIWAIFSIIITTFFSFYFSYTTVKNSDQAHNNEVEDATKEAISEFERKVNFLISEKIGLNKNFSVVQDTIEIRLLTKKLVFISETDSIMVKPISIQDGETGLDCIQSADLMFFIKNRIISSSTLEETFKLNSSSKSYNYLDNMLRVSKGDTIKFNECILVIDKVLVKEKYCDPLGDEYDAVIIRKLINNR